jgi:hypothetical protein
LHAYREFGPYWVVAFARHQVPVKVRPPAVSCTPGSALSTMIWFGAGDGEVDGLMVKVSAPDVPPPGEGVDTLTGTEAAVASSLAAMSACSWLALTSLVVRTAPFHRTTEEATKPLPLTVSVNGPLPAIVEAGDRLVITGTGADVGRALNVAVTVMFAFTVTAQVPVPVQAPLQPANPDPEAAEGVSVN